MKKQLRNLSFLGIVAILAFTALFAGAKKQSTFEIYGEDALSTTAPDGIVAAARHDVHQLLADWKTDANGKRHDPSFHEGSRGWTTTAKTEKTPTFAIGRATTEFTDAKGNHLVIEIISGKDMPTLVFFSPPADKGNMTLINAFINSLQKQGVKPIDN
jgi:hypothetical protein